MSLFDVGRICVKIAGRDSGKKCVVVEQLDNTYVVVDGSTRRKKVNIRHLEPLAEIVSLKKGASHADVSKAFEKLGFPVWETKKKAVPPRPQRRRKKRPAAPETAAKTSAGKSLPEKNAASDTTSSDKKPAPPKPAEG